MCAAVAGTAAAGSGAGAELQNFSHDIESIDGAGASACAAGAASTGAELLGL
jgi:hypothetical protein